MSSTHSPEVISLAEDEVPLGEERGADLAEAAVAAAALEAVLVPVHVQRLQQVPEQTKTESVRKCAALSHRTSPLSHLSCIFLPQPAHSCGPAVFCVSVFTDMVILLQEKKESSSKLKLQTIDYQVVGSARPHVWYIWFSCRFLKTFDSRLVSAFIHFKYCPQRDTGCPPPVRPRPRATFSLFDVTELRSAERRWEREAATEQLGEMERTFSRAHLL